ncbi:GIY-YIG nuclease family protein [Bacillus sp. NPDC077027]|uniref:GIY-YIG nuclease family protein n=1 Tax=Bacillus sp. NPDC077027 TaxID=3390548 RepID=UPI003D0630EF
MVTIKELIEDRLLVTPNINESTTVSKMLDGGRFQKRGGVYIFYTKHHEPLYVGISNNVGKRVAEHLQSKKGNADLVRFTNAHPDSYVNVFYESDKVYQELYESYLIAVLNPRFNIQKTGREKI